MVFLAFSISTRAPHLSGHSTDWPLHVVVYLCLTVAGFMMLFYPERAFRTAIKPRWLGLPFLVVGVIGTFAWLIHAFS